MNSSGKPICSTCPSLNKHNLSASFIASAISYVKKKIVSLILLLELLLRLSLHLYVIVIQQTILVVFCLCKCLNLSKPSSEVHQSACLYLHQTCFPSEALGQYFLRLSYAERVQFVEAHNP